MKIRRAPFRLQGGVHPSYHKESTRGRLIETPRLPAVLRVSLAQHLGSPSMPVVKKGDGVLRGQLLAEPSGYVSSAVHAPTSGKVIAVDAFPGPSGTSVPMVAIEPDGEDRWIDSIRPQEDWRTRDRKALVDIVANAGIIGMGGAGFPTHVKLSPPADKPIDTLIINGAECEPYLSADHRLMVEFPERVWEGAQILRHLLSARYLRLAVEDNKPDAIAALERVMQNADDDTEIVVLRTEYPQGAEKQQIAAITGREVPSGGLPMHVGVLVENVATTAAVWDAVVNGRPLTERLTTVTGPLVVRPSNLCVRIGTLFSDVVAFCGGLRGRPGKIICGGPMMGLAQAGLDSPVTKTTSGLLVLPPEEVVVYESRPCIACGRCVDACPMRLLPCELSRFLEAEDYDGAEAYHVMDCIECGCCAYTCPARRPLVQHIRVGKAAVQRTRKAAKDRAAHKAVSAGC